MGMWNAPCMVNITVQLLLLLFSFFVVHTNETKKEMNEDDAKRILSPLRWCLALWRDVSNVLTIPRSATATTTTKYIYFYLDQVIATEKCMRRLWNKTDKTQITNYTLCLYTQRAEYTWIWICARNHLLFMSMRSMCVGATAPSIFSATRLAVHWKISCNVDERETAAKRRNEIKSI